jgi:hypothetical protein
MVVIPSQSHVPVDHHAREDFVIDDCLHPVSQAQLHGHAGVEVLLQHQEIDDIGHVMAAEMESKNLFKKKEIPQMDELPAPNLEG